MNSVQEYFDSGETLPAEIINCNSFLRKDGIVLSEKDASMIVVSRTESLKRYGRIDLSGKLSLEIIKAFSSSLYIDADSFADTVCRLNDIFYEFRGEIPRGVSDREIIDFMFKVFEGSCHGVLSLLEEREMVRFARGFAVGEMYSGEEADYERDYD